MDANLVALDPDLRLQLLTLRQTQQRRHHPHEFIIIPVLITVPKDGQEGNEEKKKK